MSPHLLQSQAWEKYQQLEGNQTFRLETEQFSALAVLKTTPLGHYFFCPYGPELKSVSDRAQLQTNFTAALAALGDLAREHQAIFLRLEPTFSLEEADPLSLSPATMKSLGLVKSHDLEPAHTWVLDLDLPEDLLLKNMKGSNVQYWRSHAKKGITIEQTQDQNEISHLTNLLASVAKRNHFNPQAELHLKQQLAAGFATLYLAKFENQILAASLVYDYGDTRYYAHAAASDYMRKFNASAVLLVQMILDAKNSGKKHFDFWGITTSDDPKHPWYGFSKFKRSFGGRQVNYAGTWDLPLQRSRYRLYGMIRRLNRLKRKFIH